MNKNKSCELTTAWRICQIRKPKKYIKRENHIIYLYGHVKLKQKSYHKLSGFPGMLFKRILSPKNIKISPKTIINIKFTINITGNKKNDNFDAIFFENPWISNNKVICVLLGSTLSSLDIYRQSRRNFFF